MSMLTIAPVKEIHGSVTVPPNGDYVVLAATVAQTRRTTTQIAPVESTPGIGSWLDLFRSHAEITTEGDTVSISPVDGGSERRIFFISALDHPFSDFIVFCLLGLGKIIAVKTISQARLAKWVDIGTQLGYAIEAREESEHTTIELSGERQRTSVSQVLSADQAHAYCGLACGSGIDIECTVDGLFSSPLRHLLPAFGYELTVKTAAPARENTSLIHRISRIRSKKKTSGGPQHFILSARFSTGTPEKCTIAIPGDALLGALYIMAKSLIPRGNLLIENIPLESWNTPLLQMIRKMGCTPGIQETGMTSLGSAGIVQVQKFKLKGRKQECSPLYHFRRQLPAMIVLSAFTESRSLFRSCEELRDDAPDTLESIIECLRTIGVRFGELNDGLVIDGVKQYDGFDVEKVFPAHLSGALAVAGLKCIGETNVADDMLKARWPRFSEMMDSVCEYKR
jgi:hypothetical protein